MGGDADAVVRNGYDNPGAVLFCRNGDQRGLAPVAGGVLQKLAENESGPFFIRVNSLI